ncbi:MAG TPA: penicillin-binding protein [Gammaproteobacteria bacterium]|nr:penicillin-binding protein [Gammaproteobacteria bacterium]
MKTIRSDYDFSPMHQRMQFYVDENILSCCASVVLKGTDLVDYKTFGYMDIESKVALREDAIYRMYSNTKLVTSVALMMLHEEKAFDLDDPLAKFIPEFDNATVLKPEATNSTDTVAATNMISIRHLLSHSAGLSYGFIEPTSVIDQAYLNAGINVLSEADLTLEEFCGRIAQLPLAFQPGSSWRYSVATDVCARLVEVLSGQRFDEYLRGRLFGPLGMVDTDFWVPEEKSHRFVTMYSPEDLFSPMKPGMNKADDSHSGQYNQPRALLSGGGGLVSTVADYSSFLRMIVNGGEWAGVRILQPETLQLMRSNQLADGVNVAFPMWAMPGTVFGLGFALKNELQPDDPKAALGEYHWGGMAGTHSWMAPAADLTGFCLTQRMPGFWHPFSHEFKTMVYDIAG